mmetsp:Transcript_128121/g.362705  ORF Transcript_128121/g.362705 Transcript_128121/m.362705 type:complete len:312 (-) Transcript_128121:32-967(-)
MGWTEPTCMGLVGALASSLACILARATRRRLTHWDALRWHHVTRGVGGVGPAALAAGRLGAAAFVFAVDVLGAWGQPQVLSMFSNQCWTVIGLYLTLAGAASAADAAGALDGEQRAGWLGCAVWVLFEVMLSCAVLVFLVVWLVLLPVGAAAAAGGPPSDGAPAPEGFLWLLIPITMHNANLLIMAAEARVNRLRLCGAHFVFAVGYGLAYLVFSWVWFLHSGRFHYFFIDWRSPVAPFGYCALIAALGGGFLASRALVLRVKGGHPHMVELAPRPGGAPQQGEERDDGGCERGAGASTIGMARAIQTGGE